MSNLYLNERIKKTAFAVKSINKIIENDFIREDASLSCIFDNNVKQGLLAAVELITDSLQAHGDVKH